MNKHLRLGLYISILQLAFSLILIASSFFNSNLYAIYHTLFFGIFMFLAALAGIIFSLRGSDTKVIADGWLVISIATAYLSIQVSPFFSSSFQILEIIVSALFTIAWSLVIFIAYRNKVSVLRL